VDRPATKIVDFIWWIQYTVHKLLASNNFHPESKILEAMTFEVSRERIADQVHRYLQNRIIRQDLREGARLIETEISAELGVSRTPVREAFLRLQSSNLIEPLSKGGYSVGNLLVELQNLLEIRVALEGYAVGKAASSIKKKEIAKLEAFCGRMESLPKDAATGRAALNQQFHETIISAARNPRLVKMVNEYQGYFAVAQGLFTEETIRRAEEEHRGIIAALKEGNAQRAVNAVMSHISRAGEHILSEKKYGRSIVSKSPIARGGGEGV